MKINFNIKQPPKSPDGLHPVLGPPDLTEPGSVKFLGDGAGC